MIPLHLTTHTDPAFPQFPIPRILADGVFEPLTPPLDIRTAFAGAFVDTGAPYVIIPYLFHAHGWIKVYRDLGQQPYRTASVAGAPLLQRFVEVGLRFFVNGSPPEYRPADPALVKAYLLDQGVSPVRRVVIGLDATLTHFPLHVDASRAFFREPSDVISFP